MRRRFEFRPASYQRDELRRPEYFQVADRRGPNPDWRWKPERQWKQNWRQIRQRLASQREFHSRDYKINRIGAAFHRQLMQAHEENAELRGSSGWGYGCLKLPRASFPAKTSGKWHRRQNERSPIRRYKPSRRLRLSV